MEWKNLGGSRSSGYFEPPDSMKGGNVLTRLVNLRIFTTIFLLALALMQQECKKPGRTYEPTWQSLKQHPTPEWFKDAKLGIFIHWGVYAVPGWAPKGKYAEWYPHNMYVKGSPTFKYHRETYGEQAQFGYKDFIPMFTAEHWDPAAWARLFKRAGARYVVPVAEHHDGFAMWDSDLTTWDAMDRGPHRDIIGELGVAVRMEGMKYAPSYHRARNWFYYPHRKEFDTANPAYAGLYGTSHKSSEKAAPGPGNAEPSEAFLKDWKARWEEFRDKYKPDILWFDGMWGLDSVFIPYDKQIMADYYNKAQEWGKTVAICNKGGVFRGGLIPTKVGDYISGDYMQQDSISDIKWENPRGVGHSFGYNRNEGPEDYNTVNELVDELVDIVSKNGNLLLDIGPRADGTIPEIQKERLLGLGEWLQTNGEAIYGTDCWKRFGEDSIRFTRRGEKILYAISLTWPEDVLTIHSLRTWQKSDIQSITMLGSNQKIEWEVGPEGLILHNPSTKPCKYAYAYKIVRK